MKMILGRKYPNFFHLFILKVEQFPQVSVKREGKLFFVSEGGLK